MQAEAPRRETREKQANFQKQGPQDQVREQISVIVKECLKSMMPLLFAKPGGSCETKGSGGIQPPVAPGRVGTKRLEQKRCASNAHHLTGEGESTSTCARTLPTQVWGSDTDKDARRPHSLSAGGLAPEAYKKRSLGRLYMVARTPGLASMIPLAVKERIWRREFIDIFSLLEIQVEGLDLTTVDKKEEERRERNRVRKERNFDN
ncbi:hypothetical protein NDU88_003802 [Pleurodeles waltl]|uniref:Uncharacterized protein n=1 Tax=Pleurodeles waltl TaxID=8319 RepID=A0AAV7KY22_PLEWA|nr:hypothetical protein NDU88_003802 [Pleurodeles waltl]